MMGIPPLLEVSPLAIIVVAQVGRAIPEVMHAPRASKFQVEGDGEEEQSEFDLAPGMKTLPTLEPIADLLASALEGFASNVEFVPHLRCSFQISLASQTLFVLAPTHMQ